MKTSRNLWPLGIIAAFGLFFIGMAGVVVIASTHREHLVNANYYEQELKFQGQINAAARAQKSGATIIYDASVSSVIIAIPSAGSARKLSGTVEFYRPSAPELDREFKLEPNAEGKRVVNVSGFAAGLWQVRVRWHAGNEDYFLQKKISVNGN